MINVNENCLKIYSVYCIQVDEGIKPVLYYGLGHPEMSDIPLHESVNREVSNIVKNRLHNPKLVPLTRLYQLPIETPLFTDDKPVKGNVILAYNGENWKLVFYIDSKGSKIIAAENYNKDDKTFNNESIYMSMDKHDN